MLHKRLTSNNYPSAKKIIRKQAVAITYGDRQLTGKNVINRGYSPTSDFLLIGIKPVQFKNFKWKLDYNQAFENWYLPTMNGQRKKYQ